GRIRRSRHPASSGYFLFCSRKTQASVRIDADVMEWLKRPGKGYQTRLNAILREAMLREQNKK
ncbi:hypothetical protein L244_28840, partial [Salmonella enterica subsp. enterica serovar Worthington str. BCH-3194]